MGGTKRGLFTSLLGVTLRAAVSRSHSDVIRAPPPRHWFLSWESPSPVMKKTLIMKPPQAEAMEAVEELVCSAAQDETEEVESTKEEDTQKNKRRMRKKKMKLQCQVPRPTDKLLTPKTLDKKEKKKRKHLTENEDDDRSKKQKRPNYFLSLPITNPKVLGSIQSFQEAVLVKDERLSKAMIPKGSFHLTLFVMQLANEDEVNLAINALLESKQPVEEILKRKASVCSIRGVGEFKHEIVYGKVIEGDSLLKEIAEITEKIFKEKGIVLVGCKGFVPHLTFMKLSRAPKLRKQGVKKIDPNLYKDFQDHYFGDEILYRLDLCSMLKKRKPSGYYHTEASIYLGQKNGREPDDAELVSLSKRLVENAVLKAVQQYIEETQGKSRQTDGLSLEPANNEKK
ncbi:A-kinase anchoring protein 7 isoform X2 [Spea bombifrons]|uniref:A-kinase anchoring protein 7 isoform X2 n=1 Tax=Spea bombifrons TaxID=233779 RepID=UPI00234A58CB|nr:A-kinase anchoring protein 7 isoform X2 [Spea bombifrons]